MKILIVEGVASSKWGGAERSMRAYCEYLSNSDHSLYLVYERSGDYAEIPQSSIYKELKQIDLSPIGAVNVFKWINSVYLLTRFVFKFKIDVLFTHTIHAFPILRIIKIITKVKIVTYFKWIYNSASVGFQAKWGLKGIDSAYGVSSFVVNYWKSNGVIFKNTAVIPDGIYAPLQIENMKKAVKLKLLYLGRIYEGKGLHLVIMALAGLNRSNITLSIAGKFSDDQYEKKILEIIEYNQLKENIEFLGFVENTNNLISQHDIVIVPSIQPEAQPLAVLEAMANCRLVIASDVGGNSEILTGELRELLFEPNINSLTKKLEDIIDMDFNSKLKLVELERRKFESNYSISKTHHLLNQIFIDHGKG